jgi:hypothetical protein
MIFSVPLCLCCERTSLKCNDLFERKDPRQEDGGRMDLSLQPPLPSAVESLNFQAGFLAPGSSLTLPFPYGLVSIQWAFREFGPPSQRRVRGRIPLPFLRLEIVKYRDA